MPTSGPIVRTGATPEFWKNWENIFGGKKQAGGKSAAAKPAGRKAAARKTAVKPAARKKAKAAGKK